MNRARRQIRNRMNRSSSSKNLVMIFFVTSLILFCATQLTINSILSPLGSQLQSFNTEKELLIEENRELEEELASSNSLAVLENISSKKFELDNSVKKQLVYVSDQSVHAQN